VYGIFSTFLKLKNVAKKFKNVEERKNVRKLKNKRFYIYDTIH